MYVPDSMWPQFKDQLLSEIRQIKMGDVTDFGNFMCAVIDQKAFETITEYIEFAKNAADMEIIVGGGSDKSKGYFIEPTVVVSNDPKSKLMAEEIFGPVLTIYVYPENEYDQTLHVCDQTSPYALTGSIFALHRGAIVKAMDVLRHAAGNFYVNANTGRKSPDPYYGRQIHVLPDVFALHAMTGSLSGRVEGDIILRL